MLLLGTQPHLEPLDKPHVSLYSRAVSGKTCTASVRTSPASAGKAYKSAVSTAIETQAELPLTSHLMSHSINHLVANDLHHRRLQRLRERSAPHKFQAPPTPDASPERAIRPLPLAGHFPSTAQNHPSTLIAPVPTNRSSAATSSPVPQKVKENTFYISVSAFYEEPSLFPCILECYSAAAQLLSPGVVIKHNNRHSLLKQWLSRTFDPNPECPRVLLVDNFLGQLVGDLFNDQEFSTILRTRNLNLVRLNSVVSLNNSLNIPFEVVDKAFKEFVTIHGSHVMGEIDLTAHTECCYKRAMSVGFTPATMQRGWAFINLERVWRQAGMGNPEASTTQNSLEAEKARIKHAWAEIDNRRVWVEQREQELMRSLQSRR